MLMQISQVIILGAKVKVFPYLNTQLSTIFVRAMKFSTVLETSSSPTLSEFSFSEDLIFFKHINR